MKELINTKPVILFQILKNKLKNSEMLNDVLIIEHQWLRLKRQIIRGVLSTEEEFRFTNKVNQSIFDLIDLGIQGGLLTEKEIIENKKFVENQEKVIKSDFSIENRKSNKEKKNPTIKDTVEISFDKSLIKTSKDIDMEYYVTPLREDEIFTGIICFIYEKQKIEAFKIRKIFNLKLTEWKRYLVCLEMAGAIKVTEEGGKKMRKIIVNSEDDVKNSINSYLVSQTWFLF